MTSEDLARAVVDLSPVLHRIAYTQLRQAADREDAVQEAIRRAWEKRGHLRDERYLETWLIRILLNVCDNIRRRDGRAIPVEYVPAAVQQESPTPLLDALRQLEDRYRLPIMLHHIEGYEVADVAAMLHLPQGTVKSRLARGRAKLRTLLQEEVFEG